MTGRKFGRLAVLSLDERVKKGQKYYWTWKCKCDCGNIKSVLAKHLISGTSTSCGCYNKDKNKKCIIDLSGQKFGKLTVIKETNKRKNNCVVWKCRCDCGNICYKSSHDLRSRGQNKCVECSRKMGGKKAGEKIALDLVGKKFGKLMVLRKTEFRNAHKRILWECQCDCGNICYVSTICLRSKDTQSCGCIKSKGEQIIQSILKNNNIKFQREKRFKNCKNQKTGAYLPFDFYLLEYNCCIEYDGIQHFKPCDNNKGWNTKENFEKTQYRDNIKNKFCKDNDIRLVRIPYTDFNKIDTDYILNRIGDKIE